MSWTNVRLIWFRELRDQLRDRRTIFSIAILPLVLYPLMGMVFLQITQFMQEHPTRVWLLGAEALPAEPALLAGESFAPEFCPEDEARLLDVRVLRERPAEWQNRPLSAVAAAEIRDGRCDAVVYFPPEFADRLDSFRERLLAARAKSSAAAAEGGDRSAQRKASDAASAEFASLVPDAQILANMAEDTSRIAHDRAERVLWRWREQIVRQSLGDSGMPMAATQPFRVKSADVSDAAFRRAAVWSKVLPFVVLVWALTGAFYPAIDLCAGEKERGTLETLLCSPALRSEIVWGKLLTVITFSTVTALLNLASLGLTGLLFFSRLEGLGKGGASLALGAPPLAAIFWLLLTIVPIAALFSGLALAIAAFARSSKEGQYYLMPLLLITLPLMVLPMLPSAELDMGSSLIPVSGVMLWLRALIEGQYADAARFATPVIAVTAGCCWLAIRWAERQFQSESVLFRESERFGPRLWVRQLRRDRDDTPSASEAMVCGLLILMITFFASLQVASPRDWPGMARMVLITQIGLIAAPALIMAVMLTRRPARTLLLAPPPPWMSLPGAVLLAVSLNPSIVLLGQQIRELYPLSDEAIKAFEPLMTAISQAPWWQVLVVVALAPAVCEELVFRGFILSGLRKLGSAPAAIAISSLLFGATHGMLQQSLSAVAIGMVIGFVAVQTGSLYPCILLHFTHNGLTVTASRLAQRFGDESWLSGLIQAEPGGDFQYRWPAVAASMILSLLILWWFARLRVQRAVVPGD